MDQIYSADSLLDQISNEVLLEIVEKCNFSDLSPLSKVSSSIRSLVLYYISRKREKMTNAVNKIKRWWPMVRKNKRFMNELFETGLDPESLRLLDNADNSLSIAYLGIFKRDDVQIFHTSREVMRVVPHVCWNSKVEKDQTKFSIPRYQDLFLGFTVKGENIENVRIESERGGITHNLYEWSFSKKKGEVNIVALTHYPIWVMLSPFCSISLKFNSEARIKRLSYKGCLVQQNKISTLQTGHVDIHGLRYVNGDVTRLGVCKYKRKPREKRKEDEKEEDHLCKIKGPW